MNWRKVGVLFYGLLAITLAIIAMNARNTLLLILACLAIMIQLLIVGIGERS